MGGGGGPGGAAASPRSRTKKRRLKQRQLLNRGGWKRGGGGGASLVFVFFCAYVERGARGGVSLIGDNTKPHYSPRCRAVGAGWGVMRWREWRRCAAGGGGREAEGGSHLLLCLASTADIGTDPGTNSIIPVVKPVARTRYDWCVKAGMMDGCIHWDAVSRKNEAEKRQNKKNERHHENEGGREGWLVGWLVR